MQITFVSKIEYKQYLKTELFFDMLDESNLFTKSNNKRKKLYNLFWVKNSFTHFTRKFEYQYIYQNIENKDLKILDAGCGISFFPDYLLKKKRNLSISLLDNSNIVKKFYEKNENFEFLLESLNDLQHLQSKYDLIYSISTIEHIPDYFKVIDEIYNSLKYDGEFLLTFDISYSDKDLINIYNVDKFLDYISIKFEKESQIVEKDYELLFNSHDLPKKDLPWRFPKLIYSIYYLLKKKKINFWPPKITVAMLKVKKIEK